MSHDDSSHTPAITNALATAIGARQPDKARPPWGLRWRSHTVFILSTVAIGIFTDLFLYTLVVPILPFLLHDRVQVPPERIQAEIDVMLAVYAGGSVLFSPVAGFVADRLPNRQLPFLVGLAALFAATLLLAVGASLPVLFTARLLQGMSSAVVWTVGMALTLETVGAENLGKAIGSMFTFISVGTLFSPTIGGALYARAGSDAVFTLGGAILVVDFAMRLLLIEKRVAKQYTDYNVEQESGSIRDDDDDSTDAEANEESPLLKSDDLLVYKIPSDQPKWVREFPFAYCLTDSSLITSLYVAFMQAIVIGSFDATLPKFSEELFGFDSLKAGLMFIPLGVLDGILGPIAGWALDVYGSHMIATLGYTFLVPVLVAFRAVTQNTKEQLILYCVLLGFSGMGLALIGAPSLVEAGAVVQRYHKANPGFFGGNPPYAQLYGLNSMVFMGGLTVGPLLAGTLKDTIGYGNMNAVQAALSFVTAVVCWLYMGKRPKGPRFEDEEVGDE